MIPILYEGTETAFTSNGLGRLPDCITCVVTEELNSGIYELDFTYPVTGANFDAIQLGRIIAVTHDDTGGIQPFDIVSYSKPINGLVDFHAVHVSYRLARYIAKVPDWTVDRISKAFTMFDNAYPRNALWHYSAPGLGSPTAVMASTLDGIPKSVRAFIGGTPGSFLDTYGGEVIWDKFNVTFTPQRGQVRDFIIRYGVNMTGYLEEASGQETYTFAIPYWTNGTTTVVGNKANSGLTPYDGLDLGTALDLSQKFEAEPSVASLQAEAVTLMTSEQTNLPTRTIEVDFIRLQDMDEYADFAPLLNCEIGDTVTVIFPGYKVRGSFRIVKVIWDALAERFKTMTLGALQTTLAQALGLGDAITVKGGDGSTHPVQSDTTANWAAKTSLVSAYGTIYIYTDYRTEDGVIYPAFKVGDGQAYVVDLPFSDEPLWEHIGDNDIHITAAERTFWNNKNRAYAVGEELILTTS